MVYSCNFDCLANTFLQHVTEPPFMYHIGLECAKSSNWIKNNNIGNKKLQENYTQSTFSIQISNNLFFYFFDISCQVVSWKMSVS